MVTKAQKQGNYVWLSQLYRYIKYAGFIILIIQLLIIPFIPFLMRIWLGEGVLTVNHVTSIAFAIFGAVFTYAGMLSTIANGLTMMRVQTICYLLAVVAKVALLFALSSCTSWVFVVWLNIGIFIPYIIVQQISLNKYFNKMICDKLQSA
jgi:O-antigen/teichoic acid export membrane protein